MHHAKFCQTFKHKCSEPVLKQLSRSCINNNQHMSILLKKPSHERHSLHLCQCLYCALIYSLSLCVYVYVCVCMYIYIYISNCFEHATTQTNSKDPPPVKTSPCRAAKPWGMSEWSSFSGAKQLPLRGRTDCSEQTGGTELSIGWFLLRQDQIRTGYCYSACRDAAVDASKLISSQMQCGQCSSLYSVFIGSASPIAA